MPAAGCGEVRIDQVISQPLLVFSRKDYPEYHEYLDRMFRGTKGQPRIIGEHDGAASLLAAIESGAGVAILPESFACSAGNRVKLVPLQASAEPIIVGAAWVEKQLSSVGEMFLELARKTKAEVKRET